MIKSNEAKKHTKDKEFYAYENYKLFIEQLPATKTVMFPYIIKLDHLRVLLNNLNSVLLTGGSELFYEEVVENKQTVKRPTKYLTVV